MPRLVRLAAVAACVVLVASGCGSSEDESSSTSETTSETTAAGGGGGGGGSGFVAQLGEVCTAGEEAVSAAAADVTAAFSELSEASNGDEYRAGLADLESAVTAAESALSDYESAVEALDPPDDLSNAFDDLKQSISDQAGVAAQLGDAPTATVAELAAALADLQQDDAAAREARTAAADELGATSCAPADPGTSSGGDGESGTTTTAG